MGTMNDGYLPHSRTTTTLCNPYIECDIVESEKHASIAKIESYSSNNFNPYSTLDVLCKNKDTEIPTTTTSPDYEDLTQYGEVARYNNNAKNECVYSLPDITRGRPPNKDESKFNRMHSLPGNATKTTSFGNNSGSVAVVHNGEFAAITGQKKQNLIYEKTKVIRTNSMKFNAGETKRRRRNNGRSTHRCFCALNIVFAVISITALILAIMVVVRQQTIEDNEEKNTIRISIDKSGQASILKSIKSLNEATNKLTKISEIIATKAKQNLTKSSTTRR